MSDTAMQVRLVEVAKELRLPAVRRDAARLAEEADRRDDSHLHYLLELLETELAERRQRRAVRRVREARFPIVKTLESFDFDKAPHLPESRIRELATGSFVDRAEPVLLLGEPGTGKTHLATALGVAVAEQGRRVRFNTCAGLATELAEAVDARQLGRTVARYARTELLVLDELGYVPLSQSDAELLFRVLGERHEKRPVVVTTNLPFSEWTQVFPEPRLCKAIVDRLTHRAHIIETGVQSIRLTDTLARDQAKNPNRGGS